MDEKDFLEGEIFLLQLCLKSAHCHLEEIKTLLEKIKDERSEAKEPKPKNNPESD